MTNNPIEAFIFGVLSAALLGGIVWVIGAVATFITLLACRPNVQTQNTAKYLGITFDTDKYIRAYGITLKGKGRRYKDNMFDRLRKKCDKHPNNPLYPLKLEAVRRAN